MPANALTTYFPFLEQPLNTSNEALSSTHAIASVGIAMLTMLETLLPAAASEVEHESRAMADHFTKLVAYTQQQANTPENIRQAISGIIMGMQFQDRNTQIMENVTGMLERYRTMLEEVCTNIEAVHEGESAPGHNIAHAVENILSSIRLSDIRNRYLEALSKAKVHSTTQPMEPTPPVQDIELF
jgi:hypothetical protein